MCSEIIPQIFVLDHSKTTNKQKMMIKLLGEHGLNFGAYEFFHCPTLKKFVAL